ncbi:glutathione S-transferase [Bradyrhizobium sp. LA8.1]
MADLRIFSYLPNPPVWKATIAARFCGVDVEVRGAPARELKGWLWDYDARPLVEEERQSLSSLARTGRVGLTGAQLFKTDAFLAAQPFGNVPAAFGPAGKVGIFESNSIMRAVARLGEATYQLYGRDAYEASRIDGFPDVSLVFARDRSISLRCRPARSMRPFTRARRRRLRSMRRGSNRPCRRGGIRWWGTGSRWPTSALPPNLRCSRTSMRGLNS